VLGVPLKIVTKQQRLLALILKRLVLTKFKGAEVDLESQSHQSPFECLFTYAVGLLKREQPSTQRIEHVRWKN
jgi:hypothetical protein